MKNIEIEETLDTLSELCCEALTSDGRSLTERRDPLLKSLLTCGFARSQRLPLQVELENRVRERLSKPISFHRKTLESLTAELQRRLEELKRWEVRMPQQMDPPEAANLSTAGHATKRRDLRNSPEGERRT